MMDIVEIFPDSYRPLGPIIEQHMMDFSNKAKDYGDTYRELGAKGQYSDISRKVGKLKRAVWEGEPLVGESVEEITADIINHCYLLLLCLEEEI